MLGGLLLDNEAGGSHRRRRSARRISTATAHRLDLRARDRPLIARWQAGRRHHRLRRQLASVQKLDYIGGLAYLGALVAERAHARRTSATTPRSCASARSCASSPPRQARSPTPPTTRSAAAPRRSSTRPRAKILHIAEQGSRGQQQFAPIGELLVGVVERIETLYNRDDPSEVTGMPTGFDDLDRMTSGLQPGDLDRARGTAVDGQDGASRSTSASTSRSQRRPAGRRVLDGNGRLAARAAHDRLASARLDQHKLRTGRLASDDWERLSRRSDG